MVEGVHRVPLAYRGRFGTSREVNVFFIVQSGRAMLIDSGMAEHPDPIVRAWEELGRPQMEAIVLTHGHPDHASGAAELKRRWQTRVIAHREEKPVLSQFAPDLRPDVFLDEGDALNTPLGSWQTLCLPGHTPGQLNFYDPERRLLISGDNVLTDSTTLIAGPHSDLDRYFDSLERLLRLPVQILVPGHGPIMDQNGWRRILTVWKIRIRRDGELLGLIASGVTELDRMAEQMYGPDRSHPRHILGKEMIRGHLDHLAREGLIVASGDSWRLGEVYGAPMPKES